MQVIALFIIGFVIPYTLAQLIFGLKDSTLEPQRLNDPQRFPALKTAKVFVFTSSSSVFNVKTLLMSTNMTVEIWSHSVTVNDYNTKDKNASCRC